MFPCTKGGDVMKSVLILQRIKIENANAISGLTYGFPAVTQFLGFVHALSRELSDNQGVKLGGVGIVCHQAQLHTHRSKWGEHVFALTRNPLTKEGKTAPFNEEGRIHLEVSLVIECPFSISDLDYGTSNNDEDKEKFLQWIKSRVASKRIAGGYVTSINSCTLELMPDEKEATKFLRNQVRKLLPGFILMDRSKVLNEYCAANPATPPLDALLDFYVLKSKAQLQEDNENKCEWHTRSKPKGGWLVPIQVGYKAVSTLYPAGQVLNARDKMTPFRFVESVYSLGEWVSPHRITNIKNVFWRYQNTDNLYICSIK